MRVKDMKNGYYARFVGENLFADIRDNRAEGFSCVLSEV